MSRQQQQKPPKPAFCIKVDCDRTSSTSTTPAAAPPKSANGGDNSNNKGSEAFPTPKTLYINICSHPDVGLPLTPAGNAIDGEGRFIEERGGIDNLTIPISVDRPAHVEEEEEDNTKGKGKAKGGSSAVVDVILHPVITARCTNSNYPLQEHVVTRTTHLAMQWVQQETGIKFNFRSMQLVPGIRYKKPKQDPIAAEAMRMFKELEKKEKTDEKQRQEDMKEKHIPSFFDLQSKEQQQQQVDLEAKQQQQQQQQKKERNEESEIKLPTPSQSSKNKKKGQQPMVVDVTDRGKSTDEGGLGGLKPGFLNSKRNAGALYGEEGSKEGDNVPEDAGNPLGYMPKSLRDKCKIVDMSKKSEEEMRQEQWGAAEDGRKAEEEKDETRKKEEQQKQQVPPEILQQERRKWKAVLHQEPAATDNDDCSSTSQIDKFLIIIDVPEHVRSMKDVDLEVEENKIQCNDAAHGAFEVPLPRRIDVDSATAKFVKSSRQLKITAMTL